LNQEEFARLSAAVDLAIARVLSKGSDDVFKPPIFSHSIESEILASNAAAFRNQARSQTIEFLKSANLERDRIGPARRGLVTKDQNTFRQVAWLDPFDAVKYLATALMLFPKIELARVPREEGIVHSHRLSQTGVDVFDDAFGYDSFRAKSSELSKSRIGKWKVVTDIANFFDRIGNHSLENHLREIGCEPKYVTLVREMLLLWAGDRRSFGIPVGSDASRILSEAVLIDVDRKLKECGVTYTRYVDDYRIFAETKAEALKWIEVLTSALADEGLSLNSRKTDVFRIVNAEEITRFANRFAVGEHEKIDLGQKVEVPRAMRVSGRSTISRFYREPGKEALKKIKAIPREKIDDIISDKSEADFEQNIKLVVKYFVYADQDEGLLKSLLDLKITSIFYISDALVKEYSHFSSEKCKAIKGAIFKSVDWIDCAYPFQVPIIRLSAHSSFREPKFVHAIVDRHLQTDCMLFYREAISLGSPCLDRARLRTLAMDVFQNVPDFVQRSIYRAVQKHEGLTDDEKRPLLRNVKHSAGDWFINCI
jgi:retron-type reverse transcriptase